MNLLNVIIDIRLYRLRAYIFGFLRRFWSHLGRLKRLLLRDNSLIFSSVQKFDDFLLFTYIKVILIHGYQLKIVKEGSCLRAVVT